MNSQMIFLQIIFTEIENFYRSYEYFCWILIIINAVTFSAYALDKAKARMGAWRISESVLLGLALIGGAAGALLAMFIFHHKTRKTRFMMWVPLMLCAHLAVFAYLIYKL